MLLNYLIFLNLHFYTLICQLIKKSYSVNSYPQCNKICLILGEIENSSYLLPAFLITFTNLPLNLLTIFSIYYFVLYHLLISFYPVPQIPLKPTTRISLLIQPLFSQNLNDLPHFTPYLFTFKS